MIVVSRGTNTCSICKGAISKGERISWQKGIPIVQHLKCSVEGQNALEAMQASYAATTTQRYPAPEGKEFYPFQCAGISYALAHKNVLIADEQGLGKTIQAIGLINSDTSIRNALIVCPNSLKINWLNELNEWLTRSALTRGIFPSPTHIVVTNYDKLAKMKVSNLDLLVGDEAQYLKNAETKRSQAFSRIASSAKKILLLSGTPMPSRPAELFHLLQLLEPGRWTDWKAFAKRYCGARMLRVWIAANRFKWHYDFSGASNLDELHDIMRSGVMIRRMKADVLTELPPKTRQIVPLEGSFAKISDRLYELLINLEVNYEAIIKALKENKYVFEEVMRVRHDDALRKAPLVIEYVENALQNSDGKVVLFCHHRDVLNLLHVGLEKYGVVCVHGDTPVDDSEDSRAQQVKRFQEDTSIRIIIGTYPTLGVGWTLTASQLLITAELPWTPAELDQAEDRIHRIGQVGNALMQHLVIDGSFDSKIAKLLVRKQKIIARVLG
jgi:SWI/SNF-related matrix-associated actin-dependent regulator of chromatin subfamily A-like protein 1